MRQYTITQRIGVSAELKRLLTDLKRYRVKPSTFIRQAIREKIERDMPKIIENEKKRQERCKLPF